MDAAGLEMILQFNRKKTLEVLDAVAKTGDPRALLGWRPGPGRAHLAWQLMHIAATDDRHLNVRMRGGDPVQPDLVRRFAGGSTPDDDIPTVEAVRAYLTLTRDAMLGHLRTLSNADLGGKPTEQAPWVYREWFTLLAWHEAHHQGQAHMTSNLYRAAHGTGATAAS